MHTVVESTTETFICRSVRFMRARLHAHTGSSDASCALLPARVADGHSCTPAEPQDIQDAFKGLPHFEESGTEPSVHKYNELATLMHVSGARRSKLQPGFAACLPHLPLS
jgi:hypothetical protein